MKNRITKKLLVFMLMIFALQQITFAQYFEEESIKEKKQRKWKLNEKVFFGGSLGLQFGTYTHIDIAPLIGYRFTPKFSVGGGVSYSYFRESTTDFQSSIYGASVFSQYVLFQGLFAHVELEGLNLESYSIYVDANNNYYYESEGRAWVGSYLLGAGFRQPIGERAAINYMILWNLNETRNSPYQNPIVRLSFNF
ncbi:MAG: hypothetical protein CSA05_01215 [Bacteroidia bacterium]|nr:MAG: hypothetical protein CSA05_01215 [Bacteroidia bacterium]